MTNRKRTRPEDWGDLEPSPVVHLSDLPEHTLEIDLMRVFEQYGSIKDIAMIPQKSQALVEFADVSCAEKVVQGSVNNILVANRRIKVNYSTSKRIVQRPPTGGNPEDADDSPAESRVLLLTIYNAQYPITVDVISQIAARHGRVARIVIFRKTHIQAMVEFKDAEEARSAKRHLNGADIYSGCCTLKVEFARPIQLTVTKNDQDTWDFECPHPGRPETNASLLGHFNNRDDDRSRSRVVDGSFGIQAPNQRSNPSLPYGQGGSFLENIAMAVNPSLVAVNGSGNLAAGRANTPVVMVYNVDTTKINCDGLFNLLCLYGNVVRIRFLRTREGSAMAQLGDVPSVERAIRNYSGVPLMGKNLLIRPSKQVTILDVPSPYELPDGSPSFKDYSNCRENRYINASKASKNRIYPPSNTLHYWNCPPSFTETELRDVFSSCEAPSPSRLTMFPATSDRSSSGLVEWSSTEEAMAALALANHRSIPFSEGRYPFVLKLSFSNNPVHERGFGTQRTPDVMISRR